MIHLRKLTISSGLHKRDTIRAFVKQNGNLEQVVFDHGDMTYDITAYTGRNRDIHQLLDAFTLDAEASPSTSAPSAWQAGMVPTLFRATMQTPHAAGNNILMTLLTKSQACLFPRVSRKRKC
jgi:hypothetical protein